MDNHIYSSDVAFTPTVKAVQTRKGSRRAYARTRRRTARGKPHPPDLAAFIEAQTSIFLATANREGQPYIQHRGGPSRIPESARRQDLGFRRFPGNRQYITPGNLDDNPKAFLFLIDYALTPHQDLGRSTRGRRRRRLIARLMPENYKARPEQVFSLPWCMGFELPATIPQRFEPPMSRPLCSARRAHP